MLDRTERRFSLKPKRLAADTAYGTGRFLGWLVGRGIAPHIPVRDASERDDGTFSRSDFRWDRRRGVYICPNNKVLRTTGTVHDGNKLRYRASKFDCDACALKMRCCPNMAARQVPRDVHEDARDTARRLISNHGMNASALRCALLISRPITVSNVCGSEVSLAHATSFTSPPSCRTSKRWRSVYSARQQVRYPRRLRKWNGNLGEVFQRGRDAHPGAG
jgi:hypothetical protein